MASPTIIANPQSTWRPSKTSAKSAATDSPVLGIHTAKAAESRHANGRDVSLMQAGNGSWVEHLGLNAERFRLNQQLTEEQRLAASQQREAERARLAEEDGHARAQHQGKGKQFAVPFTQMVKSTAGISR